MAYADFFKTAFDELAVDGCIGDPQGQLSYGYVRIASIGQTDDERAIWKPQLEHVQAAASRSNRKIPFALVFADCHSGLDFEGRSSLSKLRSEYTSPQRRATTVVIEHVSRLSRVERHFTFLLDEMHANGITSIFWRPLSLQGDINIRQLPAHWLKDFDLSDE